MKPTRTLYRMIFFSMVMLMSACSKVNQAESEITFNHALPVPEEYTISHTKDFLELQQVIIASQNYAAFWNSGDEYFLNKALSEHFMDLNLPEGRPQGIEGPKLASKTFRKAVPNLKAKIKRMVISDDKAVVQYQFTGNFKGVFNGKQGANQPIDFKAIDLYTIKDGKIISNWHLEDNLTLLLKMKVVDFVK